MRKQSKVVLILLIGLVLIAAVATAGLFYGIPHYTRKFVRGMLPHVERMLGRKITIARITLNSMSHMTLNDVVIRGQKPSDKPLATIKQIDVHFLVRSYMKRRIRLNRVKVQGVVLRLRRHADGSNSVADVIKRLKKLLLRSGGGSGKRSALFKYVEKHVPPLELRDARMYFVDDSGLLRKLTGRVDRLSLVDIKVDARNPSRFADDRQLEFRGSARLPLSRRAPFLFSGKLDGDNRKGRVTVTFPSPEDFVVQGKAFRVAALEIYSRTRFKLFGVSVAHRLKNTRNMILTAKQLEVELKSGPGLLKGTTPLLKRVLARIDSLQLTEPVFFVNPYGALVRSPKVLDRLMTTEPEPELKENKKGRRRRRKRRLKRKRRRRFSLRKAAVRVFSGVQRRFERFKGFVFAHVNRFPLKELRIIRGVIQAEGGPGKKNNGQKLSNFNVLVKKDRTSGDFHFRVDFLSHQGGVQKNHITGRANPKTKDFRLSLKIPKLKLYGYRQLFPKLVRVQKDSQLQDTALTLVYAGESNKLTIRGTFYYYNLEVQANWLANDPLSEMSIGIKANWILDFKEPSLKFKSSALTFNRMRFVFDGEVTRLFEAPVFALTLSMDETRLQHILDSIPGALIPLLEGTEISGTFSFYFKGGLDTSNYNTLKYKIYSNPKNDFLVKTGAKLNFERLLGTFTHVVEEKDGHRIKIPIGPEKPSFSSLENISPYMPKVVTTTEDGNFWNHKGFSTTQIRQSIIDNLKRGRFYRGASTITQQLVKNLFLARERTIARKLQEVLITWQLEKYLTKNRIMELYLNIIEMGPRVYGITNAARHYFDKTPREMTLVDCVFIASILPNPRKYYYQFERTELTDGWRRKLARYTAIMHRRGKITAEELKAAHPFNPSFKNRKKETPTPNKQPLKLKPNPYE